MNRGDWRFLRAGPRPSRWAAAVIATILTVSIHGCVLVSGDFSLFPSTQEPLEEQEVAGKGDDKILLIDIADVIQSQEESGTFGFGGRESTTARVSAELAKAAKDDDVKALVLRINSPGGTVTASDEIFELLLQFKRERKVPIVAYFLDVAASGGYYVALAADEIVASPTTVTGSIGVVMHGLNVEGLMKIVGVSNQTIKSGARKDIGSPLRPMEPEEREILQGLVDDMKLRFVTVLQQQRPGISTASRELISDGRVVSASQALSLGLIDGIGYLPSAVERAQRRAGLSQAQVIRYHRAHEAAETMYSRSVAPRTQINLFNLQHLASPNFYYLWSPALEP